jgi:peroxiredoxin family protein
MPRGLALALHSDQPDRLHYALVLAAAAAAIDRKVILFFAGPSILAASRMPGWRGLAGADAFQARCEAAKIAGFPDLLEAIDALGVERLACELALALADLRPDQLTPGVAVGGAVTFLTRARDSETLFV